MRKLGGSTGKKVLSPQGRKNGGSSAEALAEATKLILVYHSGRTAEAQRKLSGRSMEAAICNCHRGGRTAEVSRKLHRSQKMNVDSPLGGKWRKVCGRYGGSSFSKYAFYCFASTYLPHTFRHFLPDGELTLVLRLPRLLFCFRHTFRIPSAYLPPLSALW